MTYTHMLKDRKPEKVETKCGLMFNPKRKTGRLEVTHRDDQVTCPSCGGGG